MQKLADLIKIIENVIPMRTNITLFFMEKWKKKTEKEDNKSDYVGQNLHLEFLQYKIRLWLFIQTEILRATLYRENCFYK